MLTREEYMKFQQDVIHYYKIKYSGLEHELCPVSEFQRFLAAIFIHLEENYMEK